MRNAAGVVFKSMSVEWATPKAVLDALDREFHFTLDPCCLGGTEDGLATLFCNWSGERIYVNPPYGRGIRKWIERANEADVAVFLLPARTDTRWFQKCLETASEIRFVRGRLKFGDATNSAPFPSVIVIFDNRSLGYTGI